MRSDNTVNGQTCVSRRRLLRTGSVLVMSALSGFLAGSTTMLTARALRHTPGSFPPGQHLSSTPVPTVVLVQQFHGHTATVRTVAWSPDGTMLASGGDDGMLMLWTPDTVVRHRLMHPEPVRALAWSPDGQRIVTGAGTSVAFVDAQTGQLLSRTRSAHHAPVTSVAWSAAPGHPVVSGSLDRRAIVWETEHYHFLRVFPRHTAPIESVTSAPGPAGSIASASQGGFIRVWNVETLQELHGSYQDGALSMFTAAFAPTGSRLAAGGQDGDVRIWANAQVCQRQQRRAGEQQCLDPPLRLQAHTAAVRSVAWSADGSYLATGGDDQHVRLFLPQHTTVPVTTRSLPAPVLALAWAPHGEQLAVATGNSVQIWTLHMNS